MSAVIDDPRDTDPERERETETDAVGAPPAEPEPEYEDYERAAGDELEPEPEAAPAPEVEAEAESESEPAATTVVPLEEQMVEALPAIARVAAAAWLRAAAWGVGTSLRAGARLAHAATDPNTAVDLYHDVSGGLRAYAREFLGISDLDHRIKQLTPLAGSALTGNGTDPGFNLRDRGTELLRQAADVGFEEGAHPAYARILSELSPDEARILRVLAVDGPQPLVDVRAANLIGLGSQLIAPSLNMIGAQAGLRRRDRVPAYLSNLARLGLIYLSDEAVDDNVAYQVLEAQPEILSTIKQTPRAKTTHRSIHLTPFGLDFCEVCLPLDGPAALDPPPTPPPQLPSGGRESRTA